MAIKSAAALALILAGVPAGVVEGVRLGGQA